MYIAADLADWLENELKKEDDRRYGNQEMARKKDIEAFVDAHPDYFAVAVVWDLADTVNNGVTSVFNGRAIGKFSTGFVVDILRLGTGAGEGSAWGIFEDVLRVASIVPWGRVAEFVSTQAFRVAGPMVTRLRQVSWGAIRGETCVPISIAQALEHTGTKLFVTLEDVARAMGKDLSLISKEGASNPEIRAALKEFKAIFDEIPPGEINSFLDVASLARNTKGVLLVSLETTVAGVPRYHQVMVTNTAKGFKIFDRKGIFNSFEELARHYPGIGPRGFALHEYSPVFLIKNWAMDAALVSKLNFLGPFGMVVVKGVEMVLGFNPQTGAEKAKEDFAKFAANGQPQPTTPSEPMPQRPLKHTHRVVGPVVQKRDWLSSIAQQWYGDVLLWPILFDYNRDASFTNPNKIVVGQIIKVPDISDQTPQQRNEYRQRGRNWR